VIELFHKHKKQEWPYENIDEAVARLVKNESTLFSHIERIQTRVSILEDQGNIIHAHYRTQLCKDCCHKDTCGRTKGIKYGDECDNRQAGFSAKWSIKE
jgi:hypothetical protein